MKKEFKIDEKVRIVKIPNTDFFCTIKQVISWENLFAIFTIFAMNILCF
jgi:hypothetical protein